MTGQKDLSYSSFGLGHCSRQFIRTKVTFCYQPHDVAQQRTAYLLSSSPRQRDRSSHTEPI